MFFHRYYERLDGLHNRGNVCTILHFAMLCVAPNVVRWAVRTQCADASITYKIGAPAVIPSGTRLRLKMSFAGVADMLSPSTGKYMTTKVSILTFVPSPTMLAQ